MVELPEGAGAEMTYFFMDQRKGKMPVTDTLDNSSAPERRRLARIVHDDRGNAQVEWADAPSTYERPVLAVEGEPPHIDGYNPYERAPTTQRNRATGQTGKRDLRKLSEWIKQMREIEARRQRGDEPADED